MLADCSHISPLTVRSRGEIFEAVEDFSYLVNRGYNRRTALDIVTARYTLTGLERALLYRGVFQEEVNRQRRRKKIDLTMLNHYKEIVVDAFNQISTVASTLVGDTLIVSTDTFVRDLAATNRKVSFCPVYLTSLYLLVVYLARHFNGNVVFVFDSQISWSNHFAMLAKSLCLAAGINCESNVSSSADKTIIDISKGRPVATSDSVIMDRVELLYDLAGELAWIVSPASLLRLTL